MQLPAVENVDEDNRSTREGVLDPITKQKIYYEDCTDRGEKDEVCRSHNILNGRTKAELQSWDTQMREGLGDVAENHQPRQVREQIHSGTLYISKVMETIFQ